MNFGFSDIDTDIILSAPDLDVPDIARLSLYLYQIEAHPTMRQQPTLAVGTTGLAQTPMPLQLCHTRACLRAKGRLKHVPSLLICVEI